MKPRQYKIIPRRIFQGQELYEIAYKEGIIWWTVQQDHWPNETLEFSLEDAFEWIRDNKNKVLIDMKNQEDRKSDKQKSKEWRQVAKTHYVSWEDA